MLMDAIIKLHDKIQNMKLGLDREREVTELEEARLETSVLGSRRLESRRRPAGSARIGESPPRPPGR